MLISLINTSCVVSAMWSVILTSIMPPALEILIFSMLTPDVSILYLSDL